MKIAMASSEAAPLAKTGGLADVVHALSRELVRMKNEVIIVLPYYDSIRQKSQYKMEHVTSFPVYLSWRNQTCNVFKTEIEGIQYYLLENQQYFGRDSLYGYDDDHERFAFFCLAFRTLLKEIQFKADIVHVHDWQASMIPVLIKEQNKEDDFFRSMRFVLTIHNPAFQGMCSPDILGDYYSLDYSIYTNGNVRFHEAMSTLKAGIIYADKITTVSKTHAEELLSREGGHGLDTVMELRRGDFIGIVNGIDYDEFNPATDTHIASTYNRVTFKKGKEMNKKALFQKLHIQDEGKPLFTIVSRLTSQKGLDLVLYALRPLLEMHANVVILGSGERYFEQEFEKIRAEYPSLMAIYIGYNDELAHQIYAASDVFLMPSLFEPCGIGQLIALRYGALPLVRMVGGLNDTVLPYILDNRQAANGFGFYAYHATALFDTMKWAMQCFEDPALIRTLRKNAMASLNDWRQSAKAYLEVYRAACTKA